MVVFLVLLGCKKEEGKGGKLSIKGSVQVRYFSDNVSKFTQQHPGADVDVYLVYGDNIGYGDKTKADYKGNFEFPYLRAGNYKVYVYSKDTTGTYAGEDLTIIQNVDLIASTTLPAFVIAQEDKRKPDEGKYNISGKLYANFYNKNLTAKTGSGYLVDEDVYIVKEGSDPLFFKKETSMANGAFVFAGLSAGDYKVYAISDDTSHTSASGKIVSELKVSIVNSNVTIGNLIVAKEDKRVGAYSVTGSLWALYYDETFTVKTMEGALPEEDVYIARDGQQGYLDKVTTDLRGDFQFEELLPGKYIVYAYSGDTTKMSGSTDVIVKKEITIGSASSSVGTLTVVREDKRKLDKGPYKISGVVNVRFCNSEFTSCTGAFPSPDFDVFIVRDGESAYFDKVSSGLNGSYTLSELPNGNYTVYVISKNEQSVFDPKQPPLITIKKQVTVANGNVSDINFTLID